MTPYTIRKSSDRKYFDHGWLKTFHTFSFASYYDPQWMGFRDLRVINEDRVAPGEGFPPHSHSDMEIISLVLEGQLAHKDSLNHQTTLKRDEIQTMSAGTGVTHSEYNPSPSETAHFLQIWILPDQKSIPPRYQQMTLPQHTAEQLIVSPDGRDGSLKIQQNAELFVWNLEQEQLLEKKLPKDRYGWLQVIEGHLKFNQEQLFAGDGVALYPETQFTLQALDAARLLFFI